MSLIVTTDIRGIDRPQGGSYDIGAFEGADGVPLDDPSIPPVSPPVNEPVPPSSGAVLTRPASSIPLIPCTPRTIVSSPPRNAGCNQGGVGWTPSYVGASGVVPVGADPVDGELLTGKRSIYLWAEMAHRNYI